MIEIIQKMSRNRVSHPPALPTSFAGKNIYLFGDSITFGLYSSDNAHRYSTLLTQHFSGTEQNNGVSSSTLEKRTPVDPLGGVNMIDRISNIPVKLSGDALLVFFFGMNDWGYNGVNYTPSNFEQDFNTILTAAFLKGWSGSSTLILSPSYPLDAAFAFYAGISGQPAPTRAGLIPFITASADVAKNYGTIYVDLYHAMEANNPSTMIVSDGVHPNDTGHAFIADYVYTQITT